MASSLSLAQLRRLAVNGNYPEDLSSPEFRATPAGSILGCFEQLLFPAMGCEMVEDSIQNVLMEYLKRAGHRDIKMMHKKARLVARGVVFECAVQLNSVSKSGSVHHFEDAFCRASLIKDPLSMLTDENVRLYLAYGLLDKRADFLRDLQSDFYNADRRHSILPIDWPLYVMAVHWTNTHCPLWLMERETILETCKHLSVNGSWSKALVEDRIKKFKLPRGPALPIVGIRTEPSPTTEDGSPKRFIRGFEVARKAFPPLQEIEFRSDFFQMTRQKSVNPSPVLTGKPMPRPVIRNLVQHLDEQGPCEEKKSNLSAPINGYMLIRRSKTRHRVDR